MTVTVDTSAFLDLLKSAKDTAYGKDDDPFANAVLLSTTRVEADAGTEEVLVATSHDGVQASQGSISGDGTLKESVLVPLKELDWLIKMVTTVTQSLKKSAEYKDAQSEVKLEVRNGSLVATTISDGAPGDFDNEGRARLLDASRFQLQTALGILKAAPVSIIKDNQGTELPVGDYQAFSKGTLKTLGAFAEKFGGSVGVYTLGHPAGKLVVAGLTGGGVTYRAVVPAHVYDVSTEVNEPEVETIDVTVPEDTSKPDEKVEKTPTEDIIVPESLSTLQ